jgi:arylsulfatase A-like enzyme
MNRFQKPTQATQQEAYSAAKSIALRCVWILSVWVLVGVEGLAGDKNTNAETPNIVFVLFDDLGYGQSRSFTPGAEFKMPHLDRLAKTGMKFTDAHSAAAVCTPTRYGVLTGRYPSRIGQFGVCTTYSPPLIPANRLTVASFLKQNGYQTACIGKWHLGLNWVDGKPGTQSKVPLGAKFTDGPNALGFDYFYGFTHARNFGTILEQDKVVKHVEAVENQPLMIEKTVQWLDERKSDEPFFLYFPMCPPHKPIVPSAEFVGQSRVKDIVGKDPKYGDWILQGDAMLGQILDALKRNGLEQNTLVIATSDNGAEHRAYAPLRESKRSIYEGGHRVPFVASWPGKIKPGTKNDSPICLNDLFATCAAIVGKKLPDSAAEDSESILPALLGFEIPQSREQLPRAIVHQSSKGDLAIREGDWKLIFMKGKQNELYNIASDLSEKTNIASGNPMIVKRLTARMQNLIDRGRSTEGAAQKNDTPISIQSKPKKRKKKQL